MQPIQGSSQVGPASTPPPVDLFDFLWKTHSYLNDYIRFADTKAALVIALSTALMGGMLSVEAHHWCSPRLLDIENPAWKQTWLGVGAVISLSSLTLAFLSSILTLNPRLWSTATSGLIATIKHNMSTAAPTLAHSPGFIYWGEILAHSSPDNYWASMSRQTKGDLEQYLGKRLFVLAGIADQKYLFVSRAFLFLLVGAVSGSLFIITGR